jgi:hypothetical protein
MPKIVVTSYHELNVIHFFTAGEKEAYIYIYYITGYHELNMIHFFTDGEKDALAFFFPIFFDEHCRIVRAEVLTCFLSGAVLDGLWRSVSAAGTYLSLLTYLFKRVDIHVIVTYLRALTSFL